MLDQHGLRLHVNDRQAASECWAIDAHCRAQRATVKLDDVRFVDTDIAGRVDVYWPCASTVRKRSHALSCRRCPAHEMQSQCAGHWHALPPRRANGVALGSCGTQRSRCHLLCVGMHHAHAEPEITAITYRTERSPPARSKASFHSNGRNITPVAALRRNVRNAVHMTRKRRRTRSADQ